MRKLRFIIFSVAMGFLFITLMPEIVSAVPPAPVIIEPVVSAVSDDNLIYGAVSIWVAEETGATNIVSTVFEYYDGISWYTIGIDTDGSETFDGNLLGTGDGWRIQWNTAGLPEGTYTIRVTMNNALGETAQATVVAFLDPTPPIPIIVEPTLASYEATVSGLVTIGAVTADEDVSSFTVDVKEVPDPYEKGVENMDQRKYKYGSCGCAPTAAASCLRYLAYNYPTPGANRYPDLVKEGGKELTKEELVEKLGNDTYMKSTCGTQVSDIVNGLRKWIEKHGGTQPCKELIVRHLNLTYWDYKKELKNSEDVLIREVWWNGSAWVGHRMTANSVSNKKNADGTYDVDFMDPASGQIINCKMYPNGTYWDPTINQWIWKDLDIITVSPPQEKQVGWVNIGTDTYGSDGWSVTWDTSEIPSCKYYLVRTVMKDKTGHEAKTYFLIHVYHPPVGGISVSVDKLPSLTPNIGLASTILVATLVTVIYAKRFRHRKEKQ